jgi:hypothetical protein
LIDLFEGYGRSLLVIALKFASVSYFVSRVGRRYGTMSPESLAEFAQLANAV